MAEHNTRTGVDKVEQARTTTTIVAVEFIN
jgi:hypothetical protein